MHVTQRDASNLQSGRNYNRGILFKAVNEETRACRNLNAVHVIVVALAVRQIPTIDLIANDGLLGKPICKPELKEALDFFVVREREFLCCALRCEELKDRERIVLVDFYVAKSVRSTADEIKRRANIVVVTIINRLVLIADYILKAVSRRNLSIFAF